MDVANASLFDGGSAMIEGVMMALDIREEIKLLSMKVPVQFIEKCLKHIQIIFLLIMKKFQ